VRVTLIGHASLLVELDGVTVLMDPVFEDPFSDDAVVACPAREVFPEKLPKIDFVVLSHAHLDHFHLRTLVRLPRDVEILCPEDPTIPYALGKLGFHRVRMLPPDALVDLGGGCQLLTTYSDTNVVEVGVVFKDRSGTFWNEVDSVVTLPTIERVRARMGRVDLLFSGYAAQNVMFFERMRAGYPLGITAANLTNVKAIAPALVVPGSAGYRFAGPLAWANPFLFPVSRASFLEDLARVAPEVPATLANPGDVFEVGAGSVTRHAQASPFVRMIEDDTHLVAFDATAPVPPLTDPNPLGYPAALIEEQVAACLAGFEAFLRNAYTVPDPLVARYRKAGFTYAVGVVFPDGHERWLHVELDRDAPHIRAATGPLAGATASHRVAASMLTARARYEKGYLYYRGFFRLTQTFLGTAVEGGNVIQESEEPEDLMGYYLTNKAPGADRAAELRLDFQLEALQRALREASA
jgi:L-ascorbate metabolism protein UlaG (beta-lactamase superfamily)